MSGPVISVVLPTRNRAALVGRAIASVLQQTVSDWELIIVDDGSTDETPRVIHDLHDPRVHYTRTKGVGAAAARNRGAAMARGRLLTFLDSDDEALPEWLSTLVSANADVVCCGFLERNDVASTERTVLPRVLGPSFDNVYGLFTKAGVYMMTRSIFDLIGGFEPDLPAAQHTELAMRLIKARRGYGWNVVALNKPLVMIHIHGGPRIRGDARAKRDASLFLLARHRDLLELTPGRVATSFAIAGVESFRLGDRRHGLRYLFAAVRSNPLAFAHWRRLLLGLSPGWKRYVRGPTDRDSPP